MTDNGDPIVLDALLWAWTNATGRLPDRNTMSPDEIGEYWNDYQSRLTSAVVHITGYKPDDYIRRRVHGEDQKR